MAPGFSKDMSKPDYVYWRDSITTITLSDVNETVNLEEGLWKDAEEGLDALIEAQENGLFLREDEEECPFDLSEMDSALTHDSGWTIAGKFRYDYYVWVTTFAAVHPVHGRVWGDTTQTIWADTPEGYLEFIEAHPFSSFCPGDI